MAMNTPFLGSKINLVSKSEIRYEGILYTIDAKDSTIALAKVKSYGTENRKTDKPVAPRDEIFEYIIFRASDIKDLVVEVPPTPTTGLSDPAIIQAHSLSGPATTSFDGATFANANSVNTTVAQGTTLPSVSTESRTLANFNSVFSGATATATATSVAGGPPSVPAFGTSHEYRSGGSTPVSGQRRSPVSENNAQVNLGFNQREKVAHRENRESRESKFQGPNRNSGDRYPQNFNHYPRRTNQPPMQQRQSQMTYRGRRPDPPRRGPMLSRAPPQPRVQSYNRGVPNRANKNDPAAKIDGDYDFEKANQEFQELENKLAKVKLDGEKKPEEPPEETESEKKDDEENVFYDKTKSFFDSISCEALERSKGKVNRIDWKQERKLNAETFGMQLSNHYRRGSAGYRGRGGYNNYGGYSRQNYGGNRGGGDGRRGNAAPPRRYVDSWAN